MTGEQIVLGIDGTVNIYHENSLFIHPFFFLPLVLIQVMNSGTSKTITFQETDGMFADDIALSMSGGHLQNLKIDQ